MQVGEQIQFVGQMSHLFQAVQFGFGSLDCVGRDIFESIEFHRIDFGPGGMLDRIDFRLNKESHTYAGGLERGRHLGIKIMILFQSIPS